MIAAWVLPALRWALYADLALVFGVPMAALVTHRRGQNALAAWRGALAGSALAGIMLSLAGFGVSVANMAGTGLSDLDPALALSLLTGSALGWALLARCMVLSVFAVLMLVGNTALGAARGLPIVMGGIAVASLAWSGHAAASQGVGAWVRLGGDMAHLLGGLTWVGALVLFAGALWRRSRQAGAPHAPAIVPALSAFAFIGTLIVALLGVTGIANLLFLLPLAQWPNLPHTLYGRLLLIKLALFAAMLGFAGLNRYVLVPALARARDGQARQAILRLRASVSLELLAALAVLGSVAWFGTLDPLGAASG